MALKPDDFHFSSMETTEDMTRYVQGGYHPIVIGNILTSSPKKIQYRIMHKLGFGSYGTVWLAQKTDSTKAFVAVKIAVAVDDLTNESAMLQAVSNVKINGGQSSHIITLLDHFTLQGPNGTHSVVVTEVVAPILSVLSRKRLPLWRKTAAYGLVQAVAHLHMADIVHGDLHLGNVGVAIPELANQNENDVMQDLSPYHSTVVLSTCSVHQTASLPAYVVESCKIGSYYDKIVHSALPQTKLFDFGSAHRVGTVPLSFRNALESSAPELVFARAVEKIENPKVEPPADIWALGATIYEIITGTSLFSGTGMSGLPRRMATMAGSLPPDWENWYNSLLNPPKVSPNSANEWWVSRRKVLRQNFANDEDTDALIMLLKKVLVLDPNRRPSAMEILQDPWFTLIPDQPFSSSSY